MTAGAPVTTGPGVTGEAPTPTGEDGGLTDAVEASGAGSGDGDSSLDGKGDGPDCGDGVVQASEECDHGVDNADDAACTAECKHAVCGDGKLQQGVEDCDHGAGNSDDPGYNGCWKNCTPGPFCGDSEVDPGHEECDTDKPTSGVQCQGCRYVARIVFLTRGTYSGALGGLAGADAKCKDSAQKAGLDNAQSFRAWLSDADESPLTRFAYGPKFAGLPYVMRSGDKFAASFEDLIAGIAAPGAGIFIDEQGDLVQDDMGGLLAWTNTTGAGKVNGMDHHCDSWTSEAALGHLGKPHHPKPEDIQDQVFWYDWWIKGQWTDYMDAQKCKFPRHLLCFEQ